MMCPSIVIKVAHVWQVHSVLLPFTASDEQGAADLPGSIVVKRCMTFHKLSLLILLYFGAIQQLFELPRLYCYQNQHPCHQYARSFYLLPQKGILPLGARC